MRGTRRIVAASAALLLASAAHAEFVPTTSWRVARDGTACIASAQFVSLPADFFLGTVEYALKIDGPRAVLRERWIVPPVGWLFPDYEAAAERARTAPRTQAFAAQFGSVAVASGAATSTGMPPETEYPLGAAEAALAAGERAKTITVRTPPSGIVQVRADALPDVARALNACRAASRAGQSFDTVVTTPASPHADGTAQQVAAARERFIDALEAGRTPDAAGLEWPGGVGTANAIVALRARESAMAEQTVLAALGVAIGRPQSSFLDVMNAATQVGELLPPERLATIRSLLLAWAAARGARERGDDVLPDDRYRLPVVGETPAYAIAEQVFRWVDPAALRADATFDAAVARELGRAAFARGRSLLRYGVLNSVDADLRYAAFELDRAHDAAWLLRARQSQAALLDAFGLTERARALRASLRDDGAASSPASPPTKVAPLDLAATQVTPGWRAHLRRETLRPSSGPGGQDVQGAYAFFDRWFSTMGALSLTSLLPADARTSLRPGVESAGLDRLLDGLQKTPKDEKEYAAAFELGLLEVQAATRGEVLGELASRAMLDPVANERADVRDPTASRRAVAAEAWLRRERAKLRAAIATTAMADAAASVRLQYLTTSFGARGVALVYDTAIGTADLQSIASGSDAAIRNRLPTTTSRYAATIAGLQSGLGDRDAVVVWYPAGAALHTFVVRKRAVEWVRVPVSRAELARRVAAVRGSIDAALNRVRSGADVGIEAFATADSAALYASLVRPIESQLVGIETLYVAPLGTTGGMPAALLVESAPRVDSAARDGTSIRWLADRLAIVRMPALIDPRAFDRNRPAAAGARVAFLGVGAPPAELPAVTGGSAPARLRAASVAGLAALPNARSELASAARILGERDVERAVLTGAAATRGALFDRLRATSPAVLMFATHGLLGGASAGPGEPALVLARDDDDDGLLRMSDIVPLDLRANLVILSACSTAPSGDDGAEPLAGLASAFMIAGARGVVASHWRVDTNVAETLTTSMLAAMRERAVPAGKALQAAEHELRADPNTAHPVFWAPFEVIGLPGEVAVR